MAEKAPGASAGTGASPCSPAMGDRSVARISVAEMKSYYVYSEWCSWLLSVAEGESLGPLSHRPLGSLPALLAMVAAVGAVAMPPGDDSASPMAGGWGTSLCPTRVSASAGSTRTARGSASPGPSELSWALFGGRSVCRGPHCVQEFTCAGVHGPCVQGSTFKRQLLAIDYGPPE